VLCILGAYAVNSDFFDIIVMILFGIIGWVLNKFGYSNPALLIGFILGPMLEESYRQTILIYGWSPLIFITRPFSLVMLILTVVAVYTIVKRKIREAP
jgi:putative tricarboxylic transport membrane protein